MEIGNQMKTGWISAEGLEGDHSVMRGRDYVE